jgi:hypothetical protein
MNHPMLVKVTQRSCHLVAAHHGSAWRVKN